MLTHAGGPLGTSNFIDDEMDRTEPFPGAPGFGPLARVIGLLRNPLNGVYSAPGPMDENPASVMNPDAAQPRDAAIRRAALLGIPVRRRDTRGAIVTAPEIYRMPESGQANPIAAIHNAALAKPVAPPAGGAVATAGRPMTADELEAQGLPQRARYVRDAANQPVMEEPKNLGKFANTMGTLGAIAAGMLSPEAGAIVADAATNRGREQAAENRFQQAERDYQNRVANDVTAANAENAATPAAPGAPKKIDSYVNAEGQHVDVMQGPGGELTDQVRGKVQGKAAAPPTLEQSYTDAVQKLAAAEQSGNQADVAKYSKLADFYVGKIQALKPAAEAHDAFHEWLANPDQYGKFMKAMQAAKGEKGAYGSFGPAFLAYHMLNQAYARNPKLLKVLAPVLAKMFTSAGANLSPEDVAILSEVPTDQPLSPTTGEPIGVQMPSAPTGQTRSRAQFALSGVVQEIPKVKQEIAQLGPELGPLQGRWNEFMAGTVGANNPKFSGLRTSLQNIATAWMRLHANSESARQEFENTLARSKSPQDLIANLDAIDSQAHNYYNQELGYGERKPGPAAKNSPAAVQQASGGAAPDGTVVNTAGGHLIKQGGKWVKAVQRNGTWQAQTH